MNKNLSTVLRDYNVYNGSNKLVGIGDELSLPAITFLTSTLSGAGFGGEIDLPSPGRTGNIEQEIPFNMMDEETVSLIKVGNVTSLTLRGAHEEVNPETGKLAWSGISVLMRGYVSEISLGKAKRADKMDSSIKMSLIYIKYTAGDNILLEIDKLNGKCIINNVDMMGDYKQYT